MLQRFALGASQHKNDRADYEIKPSCRRVSIDDCDEGEGASSGNLYRPSDDGSAQNWRHQSFWVAQCSNLAAAQHALEEAKESGLQGILFQQHKEDQLSSAAKIIPFEGNN